MILSTAGTVLLLVACACLFTTREYTASSFIEVREAYTASLANPALAAKAGAKNASSGPSALQVALQDQLHTLQSHPLALQVIQELNLEQSVDLKLRLNPAGWAERLMSGRSAAGVEDSPQRQESMVAEFHRRLRVRAVPQTRLMAISYTSTDRNVAADVVNHLVKALIAENDNPRFGSANPVSQKLEAQLSDFRKRSEDLQKKADVLQQDGAANAPGANGESAQLPENLRRSAAALSRATVNRLLKQAAYDVAKSGNAQAISQLSGTQTSAAASPAGATDAAATIQRLVSQESALKSQIEQESGRFGPSYPPLVRDQAALRTVLQSLQDETALVQTQTRAEYDLAVQMEESSRAAYDADRAQAARSSDPGIEGSIVSQEAEQSKQLYEDLVRRLRQQDITAALPTATLTVVDAAMPPARASAPNVPAYLLSGLVGGLLLGCAAALFAEARSKPVRPSVKSVKLRR